MDILATVLCTINYTTFGVFYVVRLLFGFFCGCRGFVIGLSQISSYFPYSYTVLEIQLENAYLVSISVVVCEDISCGDVQTIMDSVLLPMMQCSYDQSHYSGKIVLNWI